VRIPVKMARLLSVFVVNLLLFHSKVWCFLFFVSQQLL
jgi:hypothetical protein